MSLPLVDAAAVSPAELVAALQQHGAVLAADADVPAARCDTMLADVAAFFALPDAHKAALAIVRSPHCRGYSRMHNERDWREQIHFGRERAPSDAPQPHWRLRGPNLWPADAGWRQRTTDYLHGVERTGRRLLAAIASAFGCDAAPWLGGDPYVLMKCIGYHPQPAGETRRGVAAHVDFSLLTLTLQDGTGGLAIRSPAGAWQHVPPVRGAWLVVVGELLQFVTGNRLLATPHRVVNPSSERTRCSVPVFVAPSLDTVLVRELPPLEPSELGGPGAAAGDHVHTVIDPGSVPAALHFGEAEWARKGENRWCAACVPAPHAAASMPARRCR